MGFAGNGREPKPPALDKLSAMLMAASGPQICNDFRSYASIAAVGYWHVPDQAYAGGVGPRRSIARLSIDGRAGRISGSRLYERCPGVVARLCRQRVELGRSGRIDPRPGIPAPRVEVGRLLGQV